MTKRYKILYILNVDAGPKDTFNTSSYYLNCVKERSKYKIQVKNIYGMS